MRFIFLNIMAVFFVGLMACSQDAAERYVPLSQRDPVKAEAPKTLKQKLEVIADDWNCGPLNLSVGSQVLVSNEQELWAAVAQANESGGRTTLLLQDGTYRLRSSLYLTASDMVIRSLSGKRDAVKLLGHGMRGGVEQGVMITGKNVVIADLSIGEVSTHAVQIHGELDADHVLLHNLRIYNTGQQMVKGSNNAQLNYSDDITVRCSLFEYSDKLGPQYYIGGIDVHQGKNWQVIKNVFRNIRSPSESVAEFAVHFWSRSESVLIEANTIVNCDRGIGLGMGESPAGHAVIKNNMIYNDGTGVMDDVGIALENAAEVDVFNNSVYLEKYPNAIEYRFAGTSARIFNNLTNQAIRERNGGRAELGDNFENAKKEWFVDVLNGDLRLGQSVDVLVDRGITIFGVSQDHSGDVRPKGEAFDIGADEF